jgi:lipopolysaccharide biosynthesis regulator YciM
MIEILLQAERALSVGLVDQAERLYRQAAGADPRNSIAVVGLARVALERADEPEAWRQARRALAIDPENVAAQRLAARPEEASAYRGAALPDAAAAQVAEVAEVTEGADVTASQAPVGSVASEGSAPAPETTTPTARREPSAIDRMFRRNRP